MVELLPRANMLTLFLIVAATLIVSFVSLVGVLFLSFNLDVKKFSGYLLGLASGGLLGGAFFHLLPEALAAEEAAAFPLTVLGILFFFVLEKFLWWRHCHEEECNFHAFTYLNLVGDAVHNFIDGLVLAGAFLTSPTLGFSTFLAVFLHEVPQEIGDFGVLVHGGFSQKKALAFNFASALLCLFGGIFGYLFFSSFGQSLKLLLPITAGGFIYIALSDLIPNLHKTREVGASVGQFFLILLGLLGMLFLR